MCVRFGRGVIIGNIENGVPEYRKVITIYFAVIMNGNKFDMVGVHAFVVKLKQTFVFMSSNNMGYSLKNKL